MTYEPTCLASGKMFLEAVWNGLEYLNDCSTLLYSSSVNSASSWAVYNNSSIESVPVDDDDCDELSDLWSLGSTSSLLGYT